MIVIASSNQKLVNRWSRSLRKKYPIHTVSQKTALIRAITSLKPRVLILDVGLPRLRAGRELPDIQELSPVTKIFVLSASPTTKEGIGVLKTGAKGYASPQISAPHLEKAVRAMLRDEVWAGRKMLAEFIAQTVSENRARASAPKSNSALNTLSARKRQIADLISRGAANKDISDQLNISEAAVKAQLTQIFRRFGVSNRLQLALQLASQIRGKQAAHLLGSFLLSLAPALS
jgi:two-component system nitrate/nitrite response regulator NarL